MAFEKDRHWTAPPDGQLVSHFSTNDFYFTPIGIPRSTLQVNSQVCLICDQSGEKIYAMAEEQCTLLSMRELCSFGSGTWCDGPDAKELQQSDNKWLACSMTLDSHIILEKKHLLQHLQNLSCLEKPATLREVLTLLEDAGEATVPQGIFMSESD